MKRIHIQQMLEQINDIYIAEAARHESARITAVASGRYKTSQAVRRARNLAVCLAIVVVLVFSSLMAATAMGVDMAYSILHRLYPKIAAKLVPVNEACEDNGIRMSVEGICVEGGSASIYVSLQDLISDRIDETTDFFDSYSITMPGDRFSEAELIEYDAQSKKATFLINAKGNEDFIGEKMTLRVNALLSQKEENEREITEISLKDTDASAAVQMKEKLEICGYSVSDGTNMEEWHAGISGCLVPQRTEAQLAAISGSAVTACGFVDGKLHVQLCHADNLTYDNHGYVYLKDAQGSKLYAQGSVSFRDTQERRFEEYIFDLDPQTDLDGYALWGHFFTTKMRTTGNWEITFPVQNTE